LQGIFKVDNCLAKWIGNKNVLEVMSGNGMLAYALNRKKANIIVTDSMKWWKFIRKKKWPVDIEQIDAIKAVEKYGREADFLLMSWPPYEDPLALNVIKKMHQINPDCICIYIGEWRNGCTADDAFFDNVEIMHDISFEQINKLYKNFKWLDDRLYLLKYKEKGCM
jgi:predicted nicotinamide N-methyase